MTEPVRLLTVPQAADTLSISVKTLYKLIQMGELRAVRLVGDTGDMRILVSSIDEMIERKLKEGETVERQQHDPVS